MKKTKIISIFFALLLALASIKSVSAYGFGVKKNKTNTQPEIGFYKSILDSTNSIYVGSSDSKNIYLTFDCGYENGHTEKILEVLKDKKVNATFFITGHYLKSASSVVNRMLAEGHVVANHSDKHKDITKISNEDIKKDILDLEKMYKETTGNNITKFYRPPAGNFDKNSLEVVRDLGYKTLFWSVAYPDWNHKSGVTYAVDEVVGNIHNGAIILLHAVSNDNAEALSIIIDKLQNKGYKFASTLELL